MSCSFANRFLIDAPSSNNLVRSLAGSSKWEQGIKTCLEILGVLGVTFPATVTMDGIVLEAKQVQRLLHDKSKEQLLSLPLMKEKPKLAAMHFMNHALMMSECFIVVCLRTTQVHVQ